MGFGSFFGKMLGGGAVEMAEGVAGIVDRFVETTEEKKAAAILQQKIQQEPDRWQAEVNKVQAGHRSMFVAGARPALMWVCAIGLFFIVVANPIIQWITSAPGPEMPTDIIMELVYLLLGLGAMRTYEKQQGLTK